MKAWILIAEVLITTATVLSLGFAIFLHYKTIRTTEEIEPLAKSVGVVTPISYEYKSAIFLGGHYSVSVKHHKSGKPIIKQVKERIEQFEPYDVHNGCFS